MREDNGRGFDPTIVQNGFPVHLGLASSKEPAQSVGGVIALHSRPKGRHQATPRVPANGKSRSKKDDRIRILIADDHPVVRQGIHSLLTPCVDLDVVGEAGTGPEVLEEVSRTQPDVLLLDIRLANADGIEIARQLRRSHPEIRIIILTNYDDKDHLFAAVQAGVQAYLLKSVSLDSLSTAIRAVHQGQRLLDPRSTDKLLRRFQKMVNEQLCRDADLSEEQLRILGEMSRGATNKEIADGFFWSEATVKKKVQEILQILDAENRTQAVAKAIRQGLI